MALHRPYRLALLAVVMAHGCAIETNPLPDSDDQASEGEDNDGDSPSAAQRIALTAVFHTANPMYLVGSEGAAPGEGVVLAVNTTSQFEGQATSLANGSFVLPFVAQVGDVVELTFINAGRAGESVSLTIRAPSVDALAAAEALADDASGASGGPPAPESDFSATVVDGAGPGTVRVEGSVAFAGVTIVVANLSRGGATETAPAGDLTFAAELAGHSGDTLAVFVVEPAVSNAAGTPVLVSVP